MKKWTVTFHWTSYQIGTAVVEAETKEEAEEKADEMTADQIEDFRPVDGDLSVEGVEEIAEEEPKP